MKVHCRMQKLQSVLGLFATIVALSLHKCHIHQTAKDGLIVVYKIYADEARQLENVLYCYK